MSNSSIKNPRVFSCYEGPESTTTGIEIRQNFFSERVEPGWIAGKTLNVTFSVGECTSRVWEVFKDFNLWQNSYGHFYSKVLGDHEGEDFVLTDRSGPPSDHPYHIVRVIPEHLLALAQPLPEGAGERGMSPDYHAFLMNGRGASTVIHCLMEHAAFAVDGSEAEALEPFRSVAPESERKWRDIFIPALIARVHRSR